jgi:hypothetical protein
MQTNGPSNPVTSHFGAMFWRKTVHLVHLPTSEPRLSRNGAHGSPTATVRESNRYRRKPTSGPRLSVILKGAPFPGRNWGSGVTRGAGYDTPDGERRATVSAILKQPGGARGELSLAVTRCSGTIMLEMATAFIVEREFFSGEPLAMAGRIPMAYRPTCCCPRTCGSG